MTIQEVLSHPKEFQYMLLSRLEIDLDYKGGHLWGIDMETHREYMTALYDALGVKAEHRR